MTAHDIDNMASRFSHRNPINTKKATKFDLDVFQDKVLFLNVILLLCYSQFHTRSRNCNANTSLFTNFKIRHKTTKIVIFLLHWFTGLVYANVVLRPSVGEKPSILTSTSVNNCSLVTSTSGDSC